jgi:stage V sporulation protein G
MKRRLIMNITEVKINKVDFDKVKAFARVTLNNEIVLTGIKVIKGDNGLFIAMPSKYNEKKDEYYDYFFPITKEARTELMDAVLKEYDDDEMKNEQSEINPDDFASVEDYDDDIPFKQPLTSS